MAIMNRALCSGHFSLIAAILLAASTPGVAQTQAPQSKPALFIKGTVRDPTGAPIPGATVILEEKTRSESVEGKTLTDGTFSFLALKGGTYIVRVTMAGFRQAASEPMQVSLGDRKQVDFTLKIADVSGPVAVRPSPAPAQAAPGPQKPSQMEFSDAPNFTVAGVTDWSNAGLHASETNARTSEALNKDMAALKSRTAEGEAGEKPKQHAAPLQGENASDAVSGSAAAPASEGEAHRAAGEAYEKAGDPLKAEHEYEAAVQLEASETNYFAWGTELLIHKAIQAAVEVFAKGAAAHPDSWRMLVGWGAALYASGSLEDAARRACDASDLQPSNEVPYLVLGKMQKSTTDALPCVEDKLARFVRSEPENAQANYYYALALWKRARGAENAADLRKQEALLQKAVRVDPKFADAYLQLGILYAAQNGIEPAVRAYKQAIAANPELGEAHYRLGLAYKRAGDNTKAAQEFALYKQVHEAENVAEELRRKELQQFVIILKQKDSP